VALDQFKTQVLLLHSEQSTLDSLSSGFGDSYTVHCATSGSEALTTLGETPINVIISAQDLPGMSGVEALREAKKRSPETIGILLAGKNEQSVEALVGEKEVFQVVHGNVTSEGLKRLVDGATQQMRLMALAQSANDMAAIPDEPAEHIIMETSENGSTIISDGTGRFPALNPDKISAAASVGSQAVDVLVLTKDQEFLTTIKESSRGMHKVYYANTLKQADELIREHKIGVAVVDAAMVGQKVEQLTLHLRKGSPRLVSIVAGRRDDGEMLMDLINRGKVYRFLLKPVSPGRARLAVEASVKHHLEAPDAAFKTAGGATPAPAPSTKAKPGPAPKPAAPKPAAPKPAATAKEKSPAPAPKPAAARQDPPLGDPGAASPADDGLSTAFGGDDKSLTETMTGIFSTVTDKFAGDSEEPDAAAADDPLGRFDSSASAGSGGSRTNKPLLLGIGAVAVAVVAGTLFWFLSGDEETTPAVEQPVVESTPEITEAEFDFGSSVEEVVDTAVDLDATLAEAETALLESRLGEAEAALQRVAEVEPGNARLPFLTAQLQQLQLRGYLTEARTATRETRFEDAAAALARARALGVSDTAEISEVAEELSAARSEQRVEEVLALATARFEEGDLIAPANDNARYYYGLVLSNDPNNTIARQGLNAIASKLVLQARTEIDNGNLDSAEALLADARNVDASSSELTATTAALAAARNAIAARERERQAAEQRRRQEEERQAELRREEAERQAAAEAAAQQAAADEAAAATASEEPVAGADQPTESATAAAAPTEPAVRQPVSISSLTRTKYVAPKYPRAAQRRGDTGWVDVLFTVTVDGSVTNVEIRDASPKGTFDSAAIRAVERWEFEPYSENGEVIETRAGVRMMFALE
jgi:TonB family protein